MTLAPGPPMGSVVACVSVVRHGAGVLAPPTEFHLIGVVLEHGGVDWGWALLGGFHLIGKIPPDQKGLNFPDWV